MKLLPLLLLSLKGCASSRFGPPQLDVGDEHSIKHDGNLSLSCTGFKPLQWKTPLSSGYEVSPKGPVDEEDYSYVSTFFVKDSPWSSDTGYYYCYYGNATDFENDHENVDSTYVYVCGGYAFVKDSLDPIMVKVSETLEINCAVSCSKLNPTLEYNRKDITNDSRVSYDPRKGFSVKNVTENDAGRYVCNAGKKNKIGATVNVISVEKQIRKPSIHPVKNQHFVKGESFYLECTVVDPENITFKWTYPNSKAKHVEEYYSMTNHMKSILKVRNASENDTGKYTCFISFPGTVPNHASMNITIREKLAPYVNITSNDIITTEEGESISWRTDMLYYPYDSVIKYTNWRGQELRETERLTMEHNKSEAQSWLRIKDIISSDFGNYTITVTTGDGAASDSSTVQILVQSTPHMKLTGVPHYLAEGRSLDITCSAEGFPKANVSLQFQDCSNGSNACSSSLNVTDVTGTENTYFPAPGNIVTKSVTFSPQTSGLLWCTGQNEHGNGNTTTDVRISDIGGVFVLHYHGEDRRTIEVGDLEKSISVVENDHFFLMCGGIKFEYKTVYLTHTSPDPSNSSNIPGDSFKFSWRARKTVEKATKEVAGKYSCIAEPYRNQQPQIKRVIITVSDEELVRFGEENNLKNQTFFVTEKKAFNLNCSVIGMPEPIIQWLKNDKVLTRTSEFFDKKTMNFSTDSKVLMFDFVFKNHEGVYTCIAKNRLNEVRGSLTIEVLASGLSKGATVGLVIACVSIALLFIVVLYLMTRVKKEKQLKKSLRANKDYLFKEGNVSQLNPNCTTNEQAILLPYDPKWEVPRENITFGKLLGSGAFGQVTKATVIGLEGSAATTVAIKMCKSSLDVSQLRALTLELKIMLHLGKHLNIVNLMGANTIHIDKGELWILVEYCRYGNLLVFMQRHRRKFISQVDAVSGKIDFETTMDPVSPLSDSSHTSYTPKPDDADGYLTSIVPQFVLSDPPLGNSAKSILSTVSCNSSASENILPCTPVVYDAHNPLYCMGVSTSTANSKEGTEGNEGFSKSHTAQGTDSTHLTPGLNTLSNTTSESFQPGNPSIDITTVTQQASSPLSPTDTKGNTYTYVGDSVHGANAHFSTKDLLSWGWQVAKGMEYLSKRNVLHGDLAARNLLLTDDNVVKISDFGMSRNMYHNVYKKSKDTLMPVKWMSVEAIKDQIFSVQSDVWAFGITLWEMFSLGTTPYPSIEISNFLQFLEKGCRMDCPKYANQDIYNIMMQCWNLEPMDRPSFNQLVNSLEHMLPPCLKKDYLDMNDAYMKMNEERFKEETDYFNMMATPTFESLTKAEDPAGSAYVNVQGQTNDSNPVETQLPHTMAYYPEGRCPSSSSPVSHYLPMKCSENLQSPFGDVFSPKPDEASRFTFPSNTNDN